MIIGIIPARKGSSTITNKAFYNLCGQPMLAYTVNAAINSQLKRIIVSADYDKEEMVPLLKDSRIEYVIRPEEYCHGYLPATVAIDHLLENNVIKEDDIICFLQPTSPLRDGLDIDKALLCYLMGRKETLVSVTKAYPTKKLYTFQGDKLTEENNGYSKEEDELLFVRNSSIYIFPVKYYLENGTIFSKNPTLYIMPGYKSIDVDDSDDIEHAKLIIQGSVKNA